MSDLPVPSGFPDPEPAGPAYLRLSRYLVGEIRRGRWPAGARLPGTRSLARQLEVSRNTVLAAYDELLAQGWLETRPASGTFVAPQAPEVPAPPPGRTRPPRPGFTLGDPLPLLDPPAPPGPEVLRLSGGLPDERHFPSELLARALRRVLRRRGPEVLGYGDPRGDPGLRAALIGSLAATRGLVLGPEDLMVTRGAQMALALAARLLVRPGDRVAVERYGYRPVWEALRLAGAALVPIPVDEQGMQVERLAEVGALRAVYLTPHHQYPTMALLSPARRAWLLAWAARRRVAVLEDDYDHEFHYRGQPVAPLASADPAGVVVYAGGLSKVLSPGLRLGFLAAPRELVARAARLRRCWDRQGDLATEAAVARLLQEGEVPRHVRRMRRLYAARREVLLEELARQLPGALEFQVPPGGLALWARATGGVDVEAWRRRALASGVEVSTARRFDLLGRRAPYLRLGFAALTPEELREAVRRLAAARGEVSRGAHRPGTQGRSSRQWNRSRPSPTIVTDPTEGERP